MKTIVLVCFLVFSSTQIQAQFAPPMTVDIRTEPPIVQYVFWICQYAAPLGLDFGLTISLVWNESRFDPNAVNINRRKIKGHWVTLSKDRGLFQINSRNDQQFARDYNDGKSFDPFDPESNIRVGVRRFAALVRQYGPRLAVCYWNAGEWCGKIPAGSLRLADRVIGGQP